MPDFFPGVQKGIFAIGTNAPESWTFEWPGFIASLQAGAKMVCADPRFTETARNSEIWLALRPGTDSALMLSLINVMIEEDLYDHEFVEKWCFGFDKLKERAKQYTPEKCAEITWIPAEKIRETARFMAKNKPMGFPYGYAIESAGKNSMSNVRLKTILPAITGNFDVPGGDYFHAAPTFFRSHTDARAIFGRVPISMEQMGKIIGKDTYRAQNLPMSILAGQAMGARGYMKGHPAPPSGAAGPNWPMTIETILTDKPYPIKAMIAYETGPMRTYPNIKKVFEALKKLELFVYVECAQMTPECMMADYVLPTTSQYERPSSSITAGGEFEVIGQRGLPKKIPGLWDLQDDFDVFYELAMRVAGPSAEKLLGWKSLEELNDWIDKPSGNTREENVIKYKGMTPFEPRFKKYEEPDPDTGEARGFGTPSGKVELFSNILETLKYDPLPYYVENAWTPISAPDIAKDYPMILTTGARFQEAQHGEHRHISLMRQLHPNPLVKIHPNTARNLGIGNGEWMYIETPTGRCRQQVKYDFGVNPKVIDPEHGWWRPELPGEEPTLYAWQDWNINVTVPDDPEQLSPELGGWCFKSLLAKIYKANVP